MTALGGALVQTMAGRDVLALAIADLEARAKFGRARITVCVAAYGADAVGREFQAGIELDASLALILLTLQTRGAVRLEDMPKGKDGLPSFVSKMRHETTADIVQLFVGVLRSAYARVPVIKEAPRDAA